MKIFFASDHAGFDLKKLLVPFVKELGHEAIDCGPETYTVDDDYPLQIAKAAQTVAAEPGSLGIIVGRSGQGEAMAANRFKGIRAAVYYGGSYEILALSRQHNNANILSLGAGMLSADEAREAVRRWLSVPFTGEERHLRRIQELDSLS